MTAQRHCMALFLILILILILGLGLALVALLGEVGAKMAEDLDYCGGNNSG